MKYFLLIILYTLLFAEVSFAQDDEEYSEEYDAIEEIEPNNSVNEISDYQFTMQNEAEDSLTDIRQEKASEAANVTTDGKESSQDKQKKIHWIPIGIFTGVAAVGGILAYVYDKQAKDATAIPPSNANEYRKGYDDSGKYQSMRKVSLGIAALGLVGIGITFLF
jgi:hypothetical protein